MNNTRKENKDRLLKTSKQELLYGVSTQIQEMGQQELKETKELILEIINTIESKQYV